MKKRILFITQHLGRTGSEMVLWYLLKNLNNQDYDVSVFCIRKGELYDLLPDFIEKHVMYKHSPKWTDRAIRRIVKMFGIDPLQYQLDKIQRSFKADVWYVNTVAVPEVFELARPVGVKLITHIHEFLYAFSDIKRQTLERVFSYSDAWIGCSDMICEKISELKDTNVYLQNSFIDTDTINTDSQKIQDIKNRLGILPDDFVWVVSGGTKYMKGLDYVLPILEHFKDKHIKIMWLGPQLSNGLEFYVRNVAEKKYPDRLIFTGNLSEDYYNYMAVANGFLLLSREETFSLVMLEAAYLGIPMVAFKTGIAAQFIKGEMGISVDNGNLPELLTGMQRIHEGDVVIDTFKMREAAMIYDVKHQLPLYEKLINQIFKTLLNSNN
ncbi:glycosyltransferase involved in cell wall biosynthesis [Pedobacter sp. CAN_A7]|uniref:glycosyltransferase family 4 protein n=1 Tax=Pedobacter sp. CAN_A7 TaxID=2787722 RepID=UPI0018C90FB6